MGRRKKETGKCKICGTVGELSFEHVPPKAAFNNGEFRYQRATDDALYDWAPGEDVKGKFIQGGIGYNSLCNRCNNTTGSWYGNAFVSWTSDAMAILKWTKKRPTLYYPQRFFPLRVIKQVITMFFSVNELALRDMAPELVRFILNREEKYLSPKYRFYAYYNVEGNPRHKGYSIISDIERDQMYHLTEVAFPPLGYVLTFDSPAPDKRLTEITHFARYSYNDWVEIAMRFPVLPTYLPQIPGDYRTKDQIADAVRAGRAAKKKK